MEKYLAGKITGGHWLSLREKKYFLMIRHLLVLFLFVPLDLLAQYTYLIDQNIPVKAESGEQLLMPWAGGLNAAHHNLMDLNDDGKDDLVVFDRTAGKIIPFLNEDNQYHYAPEYQNFFPSDITNWLLLRDFNCDGRKDIFTGNSLGIKVYTNVTAPGENLSWEHYVFLTGFGGTSPVLLTKGFTAKINLQLQFDDLPSIVDADGDGDLDIFNVRFVGNGTVEYHQNFSMERYGTCDSLDYERITQQWGGFTECSCGVFAFNNEDCPPGGRTKHAGGKSLLVIDTDGDTDLDVLFSEASCRTLMLLENIGTTSSPVMNNPRSFPIGAPAEFSIYPAAFYEDLDFDGKKDLVAIPNIFSRAQFDSDLSHSNWFYKNNGSTASPNFSFTKTNFLQEHMIDVGDNAVPSFADYDGDGDYDMFISQHLSTEGPAKIAFYENTGTSGQPEFTFVEDDMWEISQRFLYNMKIQFVDVNADAKIDLTMTATSLQTGATRLYRILNTSERGLDFSGQYLIEMGAFNVGFSENTHLTDVNKDGVLDLLIGKSTGSLEYWRNTSSAEYGSMILTLDDDSYLGLGSTVLRQNIACFTSDLDGDGKTDLAFKDQAGSLKVVSDFRNATDATGATDVVVFNPLRENYESVNLGGNIWPTASNLFGTTKPTLIVGSVLGGLTVLRHDGSEALPETPTIEIYPNPLSKDDGLTIKIDRPGTVQIFTTLGQEIMSPYYLPANQEIVFRMRYQAAGMYILKFTMDNRSYTRRVVVY